jgi:hypothetical protein
MEDVTNPSVALGKVARVELCGCGGTVILSLGAVSLRLDLATAADVAATLDFALSLAARAEGAARAAVEDVRSEDPN